MVSGRKEVRLSRVLQIAPRQYVMLIVSVRHSQFRPRAFPIVRFTEARTSSAQAAAEQHRAAGQGYLSGNFAPVTEEVFETNLPIEGFLPPALEGVFIRNGPNPRFAPDSPSKYHWCGTEQCMWLLRVRRPSLRVDAISAP